MREDISEIRRRNQETGLSEKDAPADPLVLVRSWLDQATAAGVYLPNTMVVATVDGHGAPSVRAVILRQVDSRGLVFYTNYESRKAREIASNRRVACVIMWSELSRQVRVSGLASQISAEESDAYFATREHGAQIEAWASAQSHTIPDRAHLESKFAEYERTVAGKPVPRPPHWGGYRITLDSLEFWQGRPDRMHDRLLYEKQADGTWKISRLAP